MWGPEGPTTAALLVRRVVLNSEPTAFCHYLCVRRRRGVQECRSTLLMFCYAHNQRFAEARHTADTASAGAQPFKVLDLFAGAGGLSAGLHSSSGRFRTERAVESDIESAASYAQNFGDVVYAGGIEDWLRDEDVPNVDLVVGGPPCQGFSQLGRQDVNDERNTLWRQYWRPSGEQSRRHSSWRTSRSS